MTISLSLKSLALSFTMTGLCAISMANTAQAADEGCSFEDIHAPYSECALSTVCGGKTSFQIIPFKGDFEDYFEDQDYPETATCEVVMHDNQVRYQCQDRTGKLHQGDVSMGNYPQTEHAKAHQMYCAALLKRYPDPVPPPPSDDFEQSCKTYYGECTVTGSSSQSHPAADGSMAKFDVSCTCNTGVSWAYGETSACFEPVGEHQLSDVCDAEVALCEAPLEGGQAETFALKSDDSRNGLARCRTTYGSCSVVSDNVGTGMVDCSCRSGADPTSGVVYGMEPGAQGAMEQCLIEVQACGTDAGGCPGGCDQLPGDELPGEDVFDCSVQSGSGRGPLGAMLAIFAGLAGLRIRRRNA